MSGFQNIPIYIPILLRNMTHSQVIELPALYHSHHMRHLEDLPYWSSLAQTVGDPILELGCGTGRVLLHLAKAGFRTFGIDNSPSMLSYLKNILPLDLRPLPHIVLSDMSTFQLATRFPLILLPCNTLSTLSMSMRNKTMENVASHLEKGGCFSFSIPNPQILKQLPAQGESEVEDIIYHPSDGEPVQVSSSWERSSEKFTQRWHYDHLRPNGTVNRQTVEVVHWIVPTLKYISEIEGVGLKVEGIFGDFDHSIYLDRSPSFIIKAILP
jgi:SAM-dependent methyltransferase